MSYLIINSIMENPSLGDGLGYRTVLFLQGCNLKCQGCHNEGTWDISKGIKKEVKELASEIKEKCFNKKLTISGGEPLMQIESLLELLKELKDFDLCLYTGREFKDIPKEILAYLRYVKVGPFRKELRTTTIPFVGSKNQKFMEVMQSAKAK